MAKSDKQRIYDLERKTKKLEKTAAALLAELRNIRSEQAAASAATESAKRTATSACQGAAAALYVSNYCK